MQESAVFGVDVERVMNSILFAIVDAVLCHRLICSANLKQWNERRAARNWWRSTWSGQ